MELGFDAALDSRDQLVDIIDGRKAMMYISYLPKEYQDVVFMRYVEDLSIAEIAEVTHDSKNTVTVRIHRGLEKLKVLIEG